MTASRIAGCRAGLPLCFLSSAALAGLGGMGVCGWGWFSVNVLIA